MIENTGDQAIRLLQELAFKLEKKVEIKEHGKKNSHIHIMINTEEKNKLMRKAENEGIDFSEWCRRKLKEDSQLDRIEIKIDKICEWCEGR